MIVHVLGVIWWVGGLAFVTLVVLPELRRAPHDALERFHNVERRFAPQVRTAVVLVGLSGVWMLYRHDSWHLIVMPAFWWLGAMIALWVLFFLMLFVLGPTGVLRCLMSGPIDQNVSIRLARMHYLHLLLLTIALIVTASALAGSHGYIH